MATNVITGKLSGTMATGATNRIVMKASATEQKQVDAAGAQPYGVTTERYATGDTMSLWAPGSTSVVCEAGGTFEVGDALMSDDKGKLVAATAAAAGVDIWIVGVAESAGVANRKAYFTFAPCRLFVGL